MHRIIIFIALFATIDSAFSSEVDTVFVETGNRYVGEYPTGQGVLYSDMLGIFIGVFLKKIGKSSP